MLRSAIEATALALILTVGQGCGSNKASPPGNDGGGGGVDGSADAGMPEASPEAGEAGAACGTKAPTGTQLVASAHPLVVLSLTGDDHAVYEDLTTQELYAVATAGGTPSDIGKMTSQGRTVWSHGSSVLYLPIAADPSTSIAPISSWTAAAGTSVISTSAVAVDSYYYTYDASKDGQYVAYFATTDAMTATLTVSTIDGKTQTPLVPNIDLTDQSCFPPAVQFVNDTVVAQYCLIPVPTADAGTPPETASIAAFTAPAFTAVTLGSTFTPSAGPVTVDPTGKLALLVSPSGSGLSLYPLAGGTPVLVDANGVSGLFTTTGDILYTTTSSALVRYTASTAMMTTLVTGGVAIPFDVSPDGNWVQTASKQNATTGLTDLSLASATTPGPATSIVTTTTASPEGFTADSKYSVFGTNFPMDFGPVTYDLESSTTAGGAASKVLSVASGALFTTGSKLVCNTNQSKATGAADIVSIDLSSTAAPTTLVTQADPNLFLTSTGLVVYSWYCNEGGMAGVWTLTAP